MYMPAFSLDIMAWKWMMAATWIGIIYLQPQRDVYNAENRLRWAGAWMESASWRRFRLHWTSWLVFSQLPAKWRYFPGSSLSQTCIAFDMAQASTQVAKCASRPLHSPISGAILFVVIALSNQRSGAL